MDIGKWVIVSLLIYHNMSTSKKVIVAAGGIVTNTNKEMLFIFRRGFWDLPKGKLDEGESIEECAVREVEEETGLRNITINHFVGITKHTYFDKWVNEEVVKESHWYKMSIDTQQELVPQTEEDIEEIKWVPVNELEFYLSRSYVTIVEIVRQWLTKLD